MSAVVDITQQAAMTALRGFLTGAVPAGMDVVLAQGNRVPMPKGPFVAMTPLLRERLETNVVSYSDPVTAPGSRFDLMPTRFVVQVDCYGAGSGDVAQTLATLFRSEYATAAMDGSAATPLSAGDPRQMPIVNAESQYEERWSFDAEMQVNPTVTTAQQFAGAAVVGLIDVDVVYPPGAP